MTIWLRRHYPNGNYTADLHRFERLYVCMGGPRNMAMVLDRMAVPATLYLRLPSEELTSEFPDFEVTGESKLPKRAFLLVGHRGAFLDWFDLEQA